MAELVAEAKKYSDVVVEKIIGINAEVTVPEGAGLDIGAPLNSTDGGETFTAMTTDVWEAGSFDTDAEVYHSGHIWVSLADANTAEPGTDPAKWEDQGAWDANGILCDKLDATGVAGVLVVGSVNEANLSEYDTAMKPALFKNKIILR